MLERDGRFFEIKLSIHPAKKDVSGITAFRKTYPVLNIASGLVICPCKKIVKISENDFALPWDSV